ncbi:MAG: DNA cytosine methyltransferase [Candidatus Thorarchaeota archaeon]
MSEFLKATTRKPNTRRNRGIQQYLQQGTLWGGGVVWVDTTSTESSANTYNFIDLFSGCGGITCGFVQAGFRPLLGIEVDPAASTTYRHNFPNSIHIEGKVEEINIDVVRGLLGSNKVHVICAGFPCPGFSVAGQRVIDDSRNTLYKQVIRFARELKPWFVLMENVPGFVTLDSGSYLESIIKEFSDIGYIVTAQILESATYGVPQFRPRTIMVGNRFNLPNPYPEPILTENNYVSIESAIEDLKDIPRNPLINHEWTRHSEEMINRIKQVQPGGSLYRSYVDAWKRQYSGIPSMTIKENHGGTHIHPQLNRVISAREAARLQSFPDSFLFSGTMKRAYFQIGNAVPPLLAKHIALAVKPSLDRIAKLETETSNEHLD